MAAPAITVGESGTINLNNIDNAEAASAWTGFNDGTGGNPSPQDEGDIFIQGTQAVSAKISGSGLNRGIWYDNTTGIDMTVTGRHLFIWCAYTTPALLDDINPASSSTGGLYIKVASDASGNNWSKWWVAGADTLKSTDLFVRYVIDLNKPPSETAATAATLTSIRWFGIGASHLSGTTKSENLILDRMDYGDGIQISGGEVGDESTWEALFQADDNISNKYGIIEKRSGVYYLKAGVSIGDAGGGITGTLWDDRSSSTVVFENPVYHNGSALVSAIDEVNLYLIRARCNGTASNDIQFGQVVGSGDGRQGVGGGSIQSDGPKFTIDMQSDIADWDTINFYGLTIKGSGPIDFDDSTKTDVIGCSFINCDQIHPRDSEFLNCFIIAPTPNRGLRYIGETNNVKQVKFVVGETGDVPATRVWQVDESITPDTFVEMTTEFEDATTGNCIPFPATEAIDDYCAWGFTSRFDKLTIDTGTARSGGTLVWEYTDSLTTWAAFTPISDGTNTLSTTGPQDVILGVPNDWTPVSLNGEIPQGYVRLRVTATMTTNPLIDEGTVGDIIEHHFNVTAATAHPFPDMEFFGFSPAGGPKWMGENSKTGVLTDSYAFSNQDALTNVGDSVDAVGQSITGDGNLLSRAIFELTKLGTPTGTCRALVYAHSGVFGTSSVPTGPILATSETVDVSTIPTSATETPFSFRAQPAFTLVNTTNYVLVFEYTDGSSGNEIRVGTDTSSPSHGGNFSTFSGSWSADSATDAVFELNTGARVIINATGATNVTEDEIEETGAVKGSSRVNNDKSITFTELVSGSEVRIYLDSDGSEVDGVESSGTTFNFSIASGVLASYVILGPISGSDAFVPIRREAQSWTVDTEIVVNQQVNRNFENPD